MSHYKPYPAYKDSGVEWLGRVPEHWQLRRLKHMARFSGGGTPARDNPEFWSGDIPWVSPKDMKSELITGAEECITAAGLSGSSSSMVPAERVLMVVRSGILKHTIPVAINSVPVALNQDMKAIWLDTDYLSSPFFMRWVQGLNDDLLKVWLKQGATVESIEQDYLSDTLIPVPPVSEREQIVQRLDRETARIDALIEKKSRFIELLREKRQALITHAVTKGLDPNVTMKDSGVEWLGEVPEHWVVSRLRHNIDGPLSYGANEAAESDEPNDPRFIRITDLHEDGALREDTFKSLPWNVAQPYLLSDGDVLLARSGATVGKSFIYRESMGPSCYAGYLIRARLLPSKLISKYFWLCTQSTYYWDFIAGSNIQATIQNVSGEKYANLWLAVPPIKEQQRIINFLEEACDRLDAVRVKTERSIELLKERRSALITAAVTGQIDLREAV